MTTISDVGRRRGSRGFVVITIIKSSRDTSIKNNRERIVVI